MTSPVTSTSVATNGADDAAGSNPKRLMTNGSSDPVSVPHSTTPTSDTATVIATSSQCSPYMSENADQRAMRRNPIPPRMAPSAKPASSSRRSTRSQSGSATSP